MRLRSRCYTLAIGAAITVAGCGPDSTAPASTGSFTGTLSGDRTGSKAGFAILENIPTSFAIYGGTTDNQFDFDLNASTAGLPSPGTYQIGYAATEFYSSVFVNDFGFEYVATGGTVTITSATVSLVKGSFSITYNNAGETFMFVGTFSAKPCAATCPG